MPEPEDTDHNVITFHQPASFMAQIAPGVHGFSVEVGGELCIPIIAAETPGNGDVGRYLDTLPRDRPVRVPNVLSTRLVGMLVRRGFQFEPHHWRDGAWTEDYVRRPSTAP